MLFRHLPLAVELMKANFYISFAGPLTYKNARKTHEVAAKIPLTVYWSRQIVVSVPEPLRGRRNEPANVYHIAARLAELRSKTIEETGYITSVMPEPHFISLIEPKKDCPHRQPFCYTLLFVHFFNLGSKVL